jgi:hypothetical protein
MSALREVAMAKARKRFAERPVLTLPGGRDIFRLTEGELARLERAMRFYYAWRDTGPDIWASGAQSSNFPRGDRVGGGLNPSQRTPGRLVQDDNSHYLRIEHALTDLGPDQRLMLRWRYVDNLTFEEMANRVNISRERLDPWWRETTVRLFYAIHPPS